MTDDKKKATQPTIISAVWFLYLIYTYHLSCFAVAVKRRQSKYAHRVLSSYAQARSIQESLICRQTN